jgi:hypothetical protein
MKSSLDSNLGATLSREIEIWGGTGSYEKKSNDLRVKVWVIFEAVYG